jgi:hypothetical protein
MSSPERPGLVGCRPASSKDKVPKVPGETLLLATDASCPQLQIHERPLRKCDPDKEHQMTVASATVMEIERGHVSSKAPGVQAS